MSSNCPTTLCPPTGRRRLPPLPAARIGDKTDYRLLANTIAHQWWGSQVTPATLNDAWITNGMSRYGELMYLEDASGRRALDRPPFIDISAGALAYDTIPLSSAGRLAIRSPPNSSP